jgi:hypothetical protein
MINFKRAGAYKSVHKAKHRFARGIIKLSRRQTGANDLTNSRARAYNFFLHNANHQPTEYRQK